MAYSVNVKKLGLLSVCEFAEFLGTKFDEDVVEALEETSRVVDQSSSYCLKSR